ncbi:hypothetical protein PHLGIDRAFT_306754 [Phlebiopsis gigantea 11061_1 CR5-6]|uniref:Uncharacterized protein n=1 Tax=Phlebiopsis gigantea (strain 11061_1 CR5-6) TaxID=745531 RepID=A0A0C3PB80_PHLG1|nr:hypothetical protein PHLGIDRAFT_306754 [Phlebiopsis gigantea 11061_1 CR5-6]
MATHVCRKKVDAARQVEHEQAELAAPEVHSAEALSDLKLKRDAKRHRKMTRKGSEWRTKDAMKDPEVHWHWVFRSHQEEVRNIRPHMTMHVKGGWQLKLEDGGAGEEEQTGWVAAFEEKAKGWRIRDRARGFPFSNGSRR